MAVAPDRVLITGASGFIGSYLVKHLALDPSMSVVAATRDGQGASRRLELCDTASIRAALPGVKAVVHCAVGDRAVTVDGTRALLRAAAEAGVRRVVYFSSTAVYESGTGVVTEDTSLVSPERGGYGAWKVRAEQACLAQSDLETVRLRPPIVYGPGSRQWVSWYAERIRSGRWGTFGAAGEGTCNLVHVSDVAAAVRAALTSPAAVGHVFNLDGPELTSWNGWFARLAEAIGAPPLPERSPSVVRAQSLASLPLQALTRLLPELCPDWLLGVPSRGELALFGSRVTYSTTAASTTLGWTPRVQIAEGLIDTVEWLKRKGLTCCNSDPSD